MAAELSILIVHESDIMCVRREGRALASQLGFSAGQLALIATAISEIARNIVLYASRGEVRLELIESGGRRGIRVSALDDGPGIANLEQAMRDGYSSGNGLGLGLPGARRLMDEFELKSEVGRGTTVVMIKWAP